MTYCHSLTTKDKSISHCYPILKGWVGKSLFFHHSRSPLLEHVLPPCLDSSRACCLIFKCMQRKISRGVQFLKSTTPPFQETDLDIEVSDPEEVLSYGHDIYVSLVNVSASQTKDAEGKVKTWAKCQARKHKLFSVYYRNVCQNVSKIFVNNSIWTVR